MLLFPKLLLTVAESAGAAETNASKKSSSLLLLVAGDVTADVGDDEPEFPNDKPSKSLPDPFGASFGTLSADMTVLAGLDCGLGTELFYYTG